MNESGTVEKLNYTYGLATLIASEPHCRLLSYNPRIRRRQEEQ